MSETDAWRGACDSTIRDKYPASLHRIVRLSFHFYYLPSEASVTITANTGIQMIIESQLRHLTRLSNIPATNRAAVESNGIRTIAFWWEVFTTTWPVNSTATMISSGAKANVCKTSENRFTFLSA